MILKFITNLERTLELGDLETQQSFFHVSPLESHYPEPNEHICGLQIGLKSSGAMCMGLVFWSS